MKTTSVKKLPLHWSTWSPVEIAIGLVWFSNGATTGGCAGNVSLILYCGWTVNLVD